MLIAFFLLFYSVNVPPFSLSMECLKLKSFLEPCFFIKSCDQTFRRGFCFYKLFLQTHNQEFFRAGQFSWNYGTLINIHLQHEKKRPRRKKISVFFRFFHNQGIFFQIRGLFSSFRKSAGETSLPSSYASILISENKNTEYLTPTIQSMIIQML